MKVLHISSGFAKTDLYTQLVSHLEKQGVSQSVYSPVRTKEEALFNPEILKHVDKHLRYILKRRDRVFYRAKIRKIVRDLHVTVELSTFALVHAHSLYSDGGAAYRLKTEFDLPYIVAVRSTDFNWFMKYRPDLKHIRNKILLEAGKIIVLSPVYREILLDRLSGKIKNRIRHKVEVIPNGIAPEWLTDVPTGNDQETSELRLLYVGTFLKRKNIIRLIEAVQELSAIRQVRLTLVGGGGNAHQDITSLLESQKYPFLHYSGRIHNVKKLKQVYREHDIFVMPSYRETFGLVYIEALSQGLPIVYSRNEGIDGYFEPATVGEAVDPMSANDIAAGIKKLSVRLKSIRSQCIKEASLFDWDQISKRYQNIYRTELQKQPQ